jgi:hypothetical protein
MLFRADVEVAGTTDVPIHAACHVSSAAFRLTFQAQLVEQLPVMVPSVALTDGSTTDGSES